MPPWVTTIIASVTSVLVAVISSGWFAKKMSKKDSLNEVIERLDDIDKKISSIETQIEANQKKDENFKEANVALLRDRFMHVAKTALKQGSITTADLEDLKKLSVPYFALDDEDGMGHILLEKVENLPLKNE